MLVVVFTEYKHIQQAAANAAACWRFDLCPPITAGKLYEDMLFIIKNSAVRLSILIGLSVWVLLSGCALQNDVATLDSHMISISQRTDRLEKRVSELEQENSKIKRLNIKLEQQNQQLEQKLENKDVQFQNIFRGLQKSQEERDLALREQFAGLRVMNDRLREEVQNLTGKSEISDHKLKQIERFYEDSDKRGESRLIRLEELIEANKNSILKLETYLNLESASQKGPTMPSQLPSGEKPSEDDLYAMAKKAFDQNDLEKAREGFEQLIKQYPKSKNADNAQFWIGEIYYREKWYEKSILEYQKVIENYPQGNKVPASLLKQGLAFLNIGDKANARLILKELINKYPKSNEADVAKKKLEAF